MNKKNILFLMADQFRVDYTGYSGANKVETPNIDKIAKGCSFTNCQTVNPICTPARTALAAGKYSHQIGMLAMSGDLSLQHPTFMQALQDVGYFTAAVGKLHYLQTWFWNAKRGKGVDLVGLKDEMKKYGYDYIWEASGKQLARQNYCDYCEYLDEKNLLDSYRNFVDLAGSNTNLAELHEEHQDLVWPFEEKDYVDIITADKIIETIDNTPADQPFFIFGSFSSPHKPFDPPQRYLDKVEYDERDDFIVSGREVSEENKKKIYKRRWHYKAMIKLVDEQIGRIFDALESKDVMKDTVIMFASDHGEMLGDHYALQKSSPYRGSVTVPLAISHPDYLIEKVNKSTVELIDITATILDIAEVDYVKALSKKWPAFNAIVPCRSLMPIISGEKEQIRDFSFSECQGDWQMIQSGKYKYIRYFDYKGDPDNIIEELYDLTQDPDETENVAALPKYAEALLWCRKRRDFINDTTPPAQTSWAPLIK